MASVDHAATAASGTHVYGMPSLLCTLPTDSDEGLVMRRVVEPEDFCRAISAQGWDKAGSIGEVAMREAAYVHLSLQC